MFVVFEGIDGSGKTVLSTRVARALRAAGLRVEHVREGGTFRSPIVQRIRELGRDARNLMLAPHAELLFYTAREAQLQAELTQPALSRADVVIADRYFYSAEVLAIHGRGMDPTTVRAMVNAASGGARPDLVVHVDVDPHLARARRQVAKLQANERKSPSRKGLTGSALQHRMREGYLALAARDPERWLTCDNSDVDLEVLQTALVELIRAAWARGVGAARALAEDLLRRKVAAPAVADPREARAALLNSIDRRAVTEPGVAAYYLCELSGPDVDERRWALLDRAPAVVAYSLGGLDDATSWSIRERLAEVQPALVALSMAKVRSLPPHMMQLLSKLSARAPDAVALALAGRDDPSAWSVRSRLLRQSAAAAAISTAGLSSDRAWALREEYLKQRGSSLEDFPRAAGLLPCASITGVDDERAWKVRDAALDSTPVDAILSISGLVSDESFDWRQRFAERATKPVMATLKGIDDARAWSIREKFASQCQETFESMRDLGGERAWDLRQRCAEVWPAAVVGSLGALGTSPEGAALTRALLVKNPGHVWLWKQAALHAAPSGASEPAARVGWG